MNSPFYQKKKKKFGPHGGGFGLGWEKPVWSRNIGINDKSGSRWVSSILTSFKVASTLMIISDRPRIRRPTKSD